MHRSSLQFGLLFALPFLLGLTGCVTTANRDAATDVRAANQEFMTAFGQGDAAAVANLYTEDAQLLPPNAAMVSGRPAIQQFWQTALDSPVENVRLETLEARASGDTAWETGRYTMTDAAGNTAATGSYVVIWKNEDGNWRLHRDIWN